MVNGKESPRFVGTACGNYSNTADIETESGRAFAEELTDAVVRGLGQRGIASSPLPLLKGSHDEALRTAFQAQGSERLRAIQMYEWKTTRAYTRVTSRRAFEAVVYDRSGTILARQGSQGFEQVGMTNLQSDSSAVAIREVSQKLSDPLNHPAITTALAQ